MKPSYHAVGLLVALTFISPVWAADKDDEGFVPLFNGKDLTGWHIVNCAPGTFFVKDNEIITTGKPTGFMRTEKMYENFIADFEWMHVNKTEVGNSGFFVWGDPLPAVGTPFTRGIEVQVLVNLEYKDAKTGAVTATSHGDVFSIWGATCKPDRPHPKGSQRCLPSEYRAKGGGEWNHYKVIAQDGVIKLHVNGKEVSGVSECKPRKGYLALESEGAECHFRNLKIKELPSSHPKPEECATVAEGHKSLFDGLTLDGWKTEKDGWKVAGGKLVAAGKSDLETEKKFGPCELVFDWKLPAKSVEACVVRIGPTGIMADPLVDTVVIMTAGVPDTVVKETKAVKPGAWNRTAVRADAQAVTVWINGQQVAKQEISKALPTNSLSFWSKEGLEIMNVFVRDLK